MSRVKFDEKGGVLPVMRLEFVEDCKLMITIDCGEKKIITDLCLEIIGCIV